MSSRVIRGDILKSSDASKTFTMPSASGTVVSRTSTDTLTNKTIDFNNNTLLNIPPGPTGATGATGATGSQGIQGIQGVAGTPANLSYSAATSTRALNSNFTPNATKAVFVCYAISISCTATLSGGQTGTVELRSDTNATPTTVRCTISNQNSVSLAIALTAINVQTSILCYLVPPGHNVRLVSSGTATISLISQSEVTITAV